MVKFDLTLMYGIKQENIARQGAALKNKDERVVSGSVGDDRIRSEKCRGLLKVARVFRFRLRRVEFGPGCFKFSKVVGFGVGRVWVRQGW